MSRVVQYWTQTFVAMSFLLSTAAHAGLVRSPKQNAKNAAIHAETKLQVADEVGPPDEFYRMKKIFLFPGLDDIHGAIATNLDRKLAEIFSKNPRFELIIDNAVIRALSPDDANYAKIAKSEAVHHEAAKAAHADATVMVRVHTAAGKTDIFLDWRDRNGSPLISEQSSLPSFSSLDAQESLLETIFESAVKRIPFQGSVTGRKGQTLTIDLGDGQINAGDRIDIARMVSVERHPLLKTLVKADYVKVGSARISSADRVLSFAEILEESPNEFIAADNKVVAIRPFERKAMGEPKPVPMYSRREERRQDLEPQKPEEAASEDSTKVLHGDFDKPKARLGAVGAGLAMGNISHANTTSTVSTDLSGSGIGAQLAGELWVTREWLLGGEYQFQNATLTGTSGTASGVSAGSASWSRTELFGGYRLLPGGVLDATTITFGFGYQIKNASIPANATYNTSNRKYSGLLFKGDADIAINTSNRALVGLSIIPLGSAEALQSVTSLGFRVGWGIQIQGTIWGRLMFDYDSASGSTTDGSTTRSDKRYAIQPTIYYYF